MARLTARRCNGIKTGFWSHAKKDDLVQRLGAIEEQHDNLMALVCDHYCNRPDIAKKELDGMCAICPLSKLDDLIEGGNANE